MSWLLLRLMLVMVPLVFVINGLTKGNWVFDCRLADVMTRWYSRRYCAWLSSSPGALGWEPRRCGRCATLKTHTRPFIHKRAGAT